MDPKLADYPLQPGDTLLLKSADDWFAPRRLLVTDVSPQRILVIQSNNVPEEYRRDGLERSFNNPNFIGSNIPYLALPPEIAGLERFWASTEFFFRDGQPTAVNPEDIAALSPEFLNERLHDFLESAAGEIIGRDKDRSIAGERLVNIQGDLNHLMDRINVGRPAIIPQIKATASAPDEMISVIYEYE